MGADSAGVTPSLRLSARNDKKIFRNGDFLIGFCGSFRAGQLLRYSFKPPRRFHDRDVEEFMATSFVDEVRKCYREGGTMRKDHEEEEVNSSFLVGYENRLFHIEADFQVGESLHNFDACGCGADLALGNLLATGDRKPEQRIRSALEAAETYSAGVRAPFNLLSM